ncbi:MAG TPA: Panacea domain-containing protein [Candidatus Limnocylindrales bacterium]|nr:Panacea domain-containing protein [Candidatus Limnocylindrales bacterium]
MTVSVHDVAAALRERLPGLGKKQLHKLLYYCQGHHLASMGDVIFSEKIYAWDMGPVVASLWREERDQAPRPRPHVLSEAALNTIGYVASRYGGLSGNDLERLTHNEEPWLAADRRRVQGGSDRIEHEWLRAFFVADARLDPDAGEPLPDPEVVTAWLAGAFVPLTPGSADTRESLLARLARA